MRDLLSTSGSIIMGKESMPDIKLVPGIEEDSYQGKTGISLITRQFSNRKLFLAGTITEDTANLFVLEMMHLIEKDEPIDIYINSPGGNVNAGLVIYDLIQNVGEKLEINMYCYGYAASMAAIILAGGQKGRRYALPHSQIMIHEPLIDGGLGGSASTIKKTADSILEIKSITNGILAKHTGKTIKEIDKATQFDNFMNAEEAIKFGIIDEVKNLF